jgi:PKHD-type hydroxylase
VIGRFVASFPPGKGGLSPDEVGELLGALDDGRMARGRIGDPTRQTTDRAVRSGAVQWIDTAALSPDLLSHLFTLACVANRERRWNFSVEGLTPFVQATSYSGDDAEHYDWHMDWGGGGMAYRKISVVTHLSDPLDYEGGSLQLTIGTAPVQAVQQPGSVTVFPSFILHRVTPVTRGRRLGAVAWVLGEPFS